MTKWDRWFLIAVLAPIAPLSLLLVGWWGSLPFLGDNRVAYLALLGFMIGIGVDLRFWRSWIKQAFSWPNWWWLGIYVFYALGFFGFFMGVPVFHVFFGLPVGYWVVRRAQIHHLSQAAIGNRVLRVAQLNALGVAIICTGSAAIALADPYTAGNLQGMFKLPFVVTPIMIYLLIGLGELMLVTMAYGLTLFTAAATLSATRRK